jgi:hypothetical protein
VKTTLDAYGSNPEAAAGGGEPVKTGLGVGADAAG